MSIDTPTIPKPARVKKLARFDIYKGKKGWHWRLIGGNGKIVATGEGHPTKAKAERAALRLEELAIQATARHLGNKEATAYPHRDVSGAV